MPAHDPGAATVSRERAKGTRFESEVCAYLRDHGHRYVERRAGRGVRDGGDIAGLPGWVLEAKALRQLDVAGAVDEAEKERANVGVRFAAAILKRRRRPIGDAYVVVPLHRFAEVLTELDGCCEGGGVR